MGYNWFKLNLEIIWLNKLILNEMDICSVSIRQNYKVITLSSKVYLSMLKCNEIALYKLSCKNYNTIYFLLS